MTKVERSDDRVGSRAADSCVDASTELWTGGCRALGMFFGGLSDSASRGARRRRSADRDRAGGCVDDQVDTMETATTSVTRAVAEIGRSITNAANTCGDTFTPPDEDESSPKPAKAAHAAAEPTPPARKA